MRNRMDERYDFVRTVTDGRHRYIRNYMPLRTLGMRVDLEWITKGYQSLEREHIAGRLNEGQERFFRPKAYEELYDLDVDPDQMVNLAGKTGHADILHRLRRALDKLMLETRDNGFIPEGSSTLGVRSRRSGAVLGATGLLIQSDKARSYQVLLLKTAQSDASPSVRVVAAEALCRQGDIGNGLKVLERIATDTTLAFPPRLQSLNALEELGPIALPTLAALRPVAEEKHEYLSRAAGSTVAKLSGKYDPTLSFSRRN